MAFFGVEMADHKFNCCFSGLLLRQGEGLLVFITVF